MPGLGVVGTYIDAFVTRQKAEKLLEKAFGTLWSQFFPGRRECELDNRGEGI